MDTVYQQQPDANGHNAPDSTKASSPNHRYQGVSYLKPIDAAKDAVPVIDLADRLAGPCKMRRSGTRWIAKCPLPDHDDRTPSFVVYTETNSWYCHGCHRGGDVVELARLAWGYDQRDAHGAAADLLNEFGHEIPQRPPAFYRKQERQAKTRAALDEVKVQIARRRLMRTLRPLVMSIDDPQDRKEEAQRIWRDLDPVARLMVEGASR
jgi:hypothetical protein